MKKSDFFLVEAAISMLRPFIIEEKVYLCFEEEKKPRVLSLESQD
jgi:hypothetical protein